MPQSPSDHERAAAGLDFDADPIRDRASKLGNSIAENGPEALFEEIENLLPESWREQIVTFPIAALALGLGVGIWLGLKKSTEIISAGSSMLSAAAMANVSKVLNREDEE